MGFSKLRSSSLLFLETRLFDKTPKKKKKTPFSDLKCVLSASVDLKYMCYEYTLCPEGVVMEFSVMSH